MGVNIGKIEVMCEYCLKNQHLSCNGRTTDKKNNCLCDQNGHKERY